MAEENIESQAPEHLSNGGGTEKRSTIVVNPVATCNEIRVPAAVRH